LPIEFAAHFLLSASQTLATASSGVDSVAATLLAKAQRQRKKVEALFAELKNQIGLRRLRLRRLKFVREQFFLAAAAQNIKRLVRFLSPPTAPQALTTEKTGENTQEHFPSPHKVRPSTEFFNTHACGC
jgi:hypothetical protein